MASSPIQHLICVTNRNLCKVDLQTRVEEIVKYKPKAILLREKDLTEEEYEVLAKDIMEICRKEDVPCILHNFVDTALKLKADLIHMTFASLRIMSRADKEKFYAIGASCHSVEEAMKAQSVGCTYLIAGHIFDTLSKKDLPPRGLDFFQEVIDMVTIPVYAIGGINKNNIEAVRKTGAAGACVMSGPMQCESVEEYFKGW